MTTLSVPLKPHMEEAIDSMVKKGFGSNKADVVRRAIERLIEEVAVLTVIQAEQEVSEGKVLSGDLRKLLKKI